MSNKITKALAREAAGKVAETIKAAADSPAPVNDLAAEHLAKEAVSAAVASPAVQSAIAQTLPRPISMWKSQALWGAVVALLPNLIILVGKYFEVEITEGQAADLVGQITALAGGLLAFYGRYTTTRPIAGTEAAAKVQSAAR